MAYNEPPQIGAMHGNQAIAEAHHVNSGNVLSAHRRSSGGLIPQGIVCGLHIRGGPIRCFE